MDAITLERSSFGDLLTVDEVAKKLRRTPTSVRHLIASGQLKSGKVGGRRMVRAVDLDEFVSAAFEESA